MQMKQNLFQTFESAKQGDLGEKAVFQKQLRWSLTNKKSIQKSISLDFFIPKRYDAAFLNQAPLFKRCFSTQQVMHRKNNQQQLFLMVYNYLRLISTDENELEKFIQKMDFQTSQTSPLQFKDNPIINRQYQIQENDSGIMSSMYLAKSISIQLDQSLKNLSFKSGSKVEEQNYESQYLECIEQVLSQKMQNSNTSFGLQFQDRKLDKKSKNLLQQVSLYIKRSQSFRKNCSSLVSIKMCQSLKESSWGSQSSQEKQRFSLSQIVRKLKVFLSLKFLKNLYFEPQPFLIMISLIYLLKYLQRSGHTLTAQSLPLLLATSLLVSYKIYEDQPVEGLLNFLVSDIFSNKLTKSQMITCQRQFLQTINYQVVIRNEEFYRMLEMISDDEGKGKRRESLDKKGNQDMSDKKSC